MNTDLLLPHQKDSLEWAVAKAPASQIVGNGSHTLPQLIDDVKRAHKGYRVLSGGKWKFYASDCLTQAQVSDLEDWLIDLEPDKKRAA